MVSKTYDAVVHRASELLPAGLQGSFSISSLTRRRSPSPVPPPPAPTLHVAVQRVEGTEVILKLPADACLEELQRQCWEQAGVPAGLQRWYIEERRVEPGLVNLLRNTATHLTNRDRMSRTMMQWVNYIFLPESVNKEIKGAGFIQWAHDNVWAHVALREPGRVQVSVVLLGDRRYALQLSEQASLRRMLEVVEKQAGVPVERQRLVVAEQRPYTGLERALWSLVRALVACWRAVFQALGAVLEVAFPTDGTTLLAQVLSEDGREVSVRWRGDMTLHQLQDLMEQQYGERFRIRSVSLPPTPPSK